jgi:hypothetical protein
LIDNGAPLSFEIFDQCSPVLPVNEGSGARDSGEPFANLLRDLAGTCAPANSKRRRRLAALPVPISISNSARRSAPRASRFFALIVFFEVTIALAAFPLKALAIDKDGRLAVYTEADPYLTDMLAG